MLSEFEQLLGYTFRDEALLRNALTHRSYANENRGSDEKAGSSRPQNPAHVSPAVEGCEHQYNGKQYIAERTAQRNNQVFSVGIVKADSLIIELYDCSPKAKWNQQQHNCT